MKWIGTDHSRIVTNSVTNLIVSVTNLIVAGTPERPAVGQTAKGCPEEYVQRVHHWPRPSTFSVSPPAVGARTSRAVSPRLQRKTRKRDKGRRGCIRETSSPGNMP